VFFLIHLHVNLIGQRVDARVAVVSTVGTVRRNQHRDNEGGTETTEKLSRIEIESH
jgi:hypothetical protein